MKSNIIRQTKVGTIPITEGVKEISSEFYQIKDVKDVLLMSDLHIKFQDNRAIYAALNHSDKFDTILINGDAFDFGKGSKFLSNPSMPEIKDEIAVGKEFFAYLRKKYPKKRIIFYAGNHDVRLKHYVWRHAPALFGLEQISLESLLELKLHGIEFIDNGGGWKIGKLHGIHGNEARISGGINAARNVLIRSFDNVIMGHVHRTSSSPMRNLSGDMFMSWTVGCLCDLYPSYQSRCGTWNWGFAELEFYKDKFEVRNKMIDKDYSVY